MIELRDFSYRFAQGPDPALSRIDLRIDRDEFVVFTGPSGCGKSTLALAIGGYLFSQYDGSAQGQVLVDDLDVADTPVYDLAEIVGLVQQNPESQFCTLTVEDEIAFGLENRCRAVEEIEQQTQWALQSVLAEDLRERMLASLSGGEKQKIAIAAMMAAKPQVLILDEPTSNLDPKATAEILDVIRSLREQEGLTVIVIEHKLQALAGFHPRLIRLKQGRVVSDSPLQKLQTTWTLPQPSSRSHAPSTPPVVHASDLTLRLGQSPILTGVSFELHAGELAALMGDNGSGKSSLLRCILGLLRPQSGRIDFLGEDIAEARVSQLARQIGFVFQNPDHQLFASTVWEECSMAAGNFGLPRSAWEGRAEQLLESAGLLQRKGDHPYQLSFGEKRRLNLISAILHQPHLLLLDEILIGQDEDNARFLMNMLRTFAGQGGTVLLVNHNPQVTAAYATRVMFLEKGRLLLDAPTGEAFQRLAEAGHAVYTTKDEAVQTARGGAA